MSERERDLRQGLGIVGACVALVIALLAFVSPAQAAKGVNGFFGNSGTLGGQFNQPRGIAVNQSNGNVYVADTGNNRI
jgi:DNA-binding beta-propeller fold protein YncE